MPPFSRAEIDAGHRLFATEWDFAAAAGTLARLPRTATHVPQNRQVC